MGRYLEGWTAANPGNCLNHSPQDNFELAYETCERCGQSIFCWLVLLFMACLCCGRFLLAIETEANWIEPWKSGARVCIFPVPITSGHTSHFSIPKSTALTMSAIIFEREVSASLEDRFGRSPVATSARFDPWRVGGLRGRSGNGGLALCHWSLWRWCDLGDGKRALGNEFFMGKTVGISESATLKSPLTIQDAAFIQWGNNEGAHRHKHILAAFGKVVFIKCLRSDCASRARPLE